MSAAEAVACKYKHTCIHRCTAKDYFLKYYEYIIHLYTECDVYYDVTGLLMLFYFCVGTIPDLQKVIHILTVMVKYYKWLTNRNTSQKRRSFPIRRIRVVGD